jgi:hypothetical protein
MQLLHNAKKAVLFVLAPEYLNMLHSHLCWCCYHGTGNLAARRFVCIESKQMLIWTLDIYTDRISIFKVNGLLFKI